MKRFIAALFLLLMMQTAAQADMRLFIGEGTLSYEQARDVKRWMEEALGEPVEVISQETAGRSFSQLLMDGGMPELAILFEEEVGKWAKEGLFVQIGRGVAGRARDVLPLFERERVMAVRAQRFEEANVGYLLDARMYPAWVPTQVLQALDELALRGAPGMELWKIEGDNTLFLEAFLQGVGGEWFSPGARQVQEADAEAMEHALAWLADMTSAELIGTAESREAVLERFIDGETAMFIDWSAAESKAYAREIERGEIVLLPYPSVSGTPVRVAQRICLAVLPSAQGKAQMNVQRLVRRIAAQAGSEGMQPAQRGNGLITSERLEGGATFKALLSEAATGILFMQEDGHEAAQRTLRALAAAER